MKAIGAGWLLVLFVVFSMSASNASAGNDHPCVDQVGSLVSLQGRAEISRAGSPGWSQLAMDDTICQGDTLRVLPNSRVALLMANDTVIRLDQGTVFSVVAATQDKPLLIKLLEGILYYFSIKPRTLELETPFINGAIEGTEFIAAVSENQGRIAVFEGTVATSNNLGSAVISSGQQSSAARNQAPISAPITRDRTLLQWTFYYPPLLNLQPYLKPAGETASTSQQAVHSAVQYFFNNDLYASINELTKLTGKDVTAEVHRVRAAIFLAAGRVKEVEKEVAALRAMDANDTSGSAFLALIALLDGRREEARQLVETALATNPNSPTALVTMSYTQQASFALDAALASITKALHTHPDDGLLLSRQAELTQSLDNVSRKAIETAERAVQKTPNLAYPHTILGFALLDRLEVSAAAQAFAKAIQLDQAAPLPRLGLGLTEIYHGRLAEGRNQLSIAAVLDPGNSLFRSYLGKAYFEERDFARAKKQLQIARDLDPNDPTPFFYAAVMNSKENKPGEALLDLRKSVVLNDNRAIFRSRLMLDRDLAARSADVGRIFNDLGFNELAHNNGTNSLAIAPADYSAHRLLADSYAVMPRHELASVSELLQSQLLQPQNVRPIQPQLAEAHMQILDGSGPSVLSSDEYNSLFNRNRINLLADGIVGGDQTLGDDLVASGVYDKFSFSLGQYYYETDGFRENNELEQQLYNVFGQYSFNPNANTLFEYRHSKKDFGDRTLLFDPTSFNESQRQNRDTTSWRIGGHYQFLPGSEIIGTLVKEQIDDTFNFSLDASAYTAREENDDVNGEIQYLYSGSLFRSVFGGSYTDGDFEQSFAIDGITLRSPETVNSDYAAYYGYGYFPVLSTVTLTTGFTYSRIDSGRNDWRFNKGSPKLGLVWHPLPSTALRMAWLEGVTRTLVSEQTIEPTQVAGFNQFYNDILDTESELYGLGLDHEFSHFLYGGISYVQRDLDVPYEKINLTNLSSEKSRFDWQEKSTKIYLNWLANSNIALATEYLFEQYNRNPEAPGDEYFEDLKTHRGKVQLAWFDQSSGLRAKCSTTYVHQKGTFVDSNFYPYLLLTNQDSDSFWIFDASVGYLFPKKYGVIDLKVKNFFDTDFHFQEMDPDNPEFSRGRLIFLQFSRNF